MTEQELKDALEQERSRYEELSEQTQQLLDKLSQSHEHADAISYAAQLGRLDIISLVLSFLGLLIALAAIFGFLEIRQRSKRVAVEAAKEESQIEMGRFLEEDAPKIIRGHLELLGVDGAISSADKIAQEAGGRPDERKSENS